MPCGHSPQRRGHPVCVVCVKCTTNRPGASVWEAEFSGEAGGGAKAGRFVGYRPAWALLRMGTGNRRSNPDRGCPVTRRGRYHCASRFGRSCMAAFPVFPAVCLPPLLPCPTCQLPEPLPFTRTIRPRRPHMQSRTPMQPLPRMQPRSPMPMLPPLAYPAPPPC